MGLEVRDITTLLEVFDMPRSIAFYRDTLGFEVERTSQPGEDFTWAPGICSAAGSPWSSRG